MPFLSSLLLQPPPSTNLQKDLFTLLALYYNIQHPFNQGIAKYAYGINEY